MFRPIAIDLSIQAGAWPDEAALEALARDAAAAAQAHLHLDNEAESELGLVFTDDSHMRALNRDWRAKDKPTNVLSFPAFDLVRGDPLPPMLGDVVLAFETVSAEALLEGKSFDHHLLHLIVHGFLHLLGYDHETLEEAEEMEACERAILARLAIPDPYG